MYRSTFIVTLVLLCGLNVIAQRNAEKLLDQAEKGTHEVHLQYAQRAFKESRTDSLKTAALDRIAMIHFQNDSLRLFYRASKLGLLNAQKRKDVWGRSRFHYRIGTYYREENDFDSAYYHYYQANKGFKRAFDSIEVVKSLLNLSIISMSIGDYVQSENESVEALQFLGSRDKAALKISCYNNLGISFVERGNFEKAKYWYTKCLDLAKSDKEYLTIYNNLGVVSRKSKKYDQALSYFKKAISVSAGTGLEQYRAMVLDNIGYTQFLSQENGLDRMIQGYELRSQAGNSYGEIVSEIHLAEYYLNDNRIKAETLFNSAHKKAKLIGNTKNELKALRMLSLHFKGTKNLLRYLSLRDSIDLVNENLRSGHASIRFESEQKELANIQLKQERSEKALELEKEKRFTFYLVVSTVGLSVLSLFIFISFRLRKKRQEMKARIQILESRFEEQDKISYLLHQDIANDLLLKIDELDHFSEKMESTDLPRIVDDLEGVYKRTVEISRDLGRHEFNKRSFERNIRFLVSSFHDPSKRRIFIKGLDSIEDERIGKTILYESFLVIKELLSNVKKYSQASEVNLVFFLERGAYTISCSDNGKGIERLAVHGIGLSSMKGRIEKQLEGKFEVISNAQGTKIEIQIPIS